MKKVNIGFDIGITSVGWAIVDEDNQILLRGVRLFEELKNPKDGKLKNQERRAKRALRRTIRRKSNRKADFIKLVINKYYDTFGIKTRDDFLEKVNNVQKSVLEIRNQAIDEQVDKIELLKVLYFFLSHRGYTYLTVDDYEKRKEIIKKGDASNLIEFCNWMEQNPKAEKEIKEQEAQKYVGDQFKKAINVIAASKEYKHLKEKELKFPCQIQQEEFNKNGHYKGLDVNATFSIFDNKREIATILENQKYLANEFVNDYYIDEKAPFSRIREYSKGPGSLIAPTPYGLYQMKDGKVQKIGDNLWDVLIGNCSVYPDKLRAMKRSVSGEMSNLISQLNNIRNKNSEYDQKLTRENKIAIFSEMFASKFKSISVKMIAKILNCQTSDLAGYPITIEKDVSKEAFDEFKNTKKLFNILNGHIKLNSFENIFSNISFLDDILKVFLKHKDNIEGQKQELKTIFQEYEVALDENILEKLISAKFEASETHSMSYQALREHINDEINTKGLTLNQKFKNEIEKNQAFDFSQSKYMNVNVLDKEVMSPTTKCAFREVIKIFNKILKLYVYKDKFKIKNIVIEMPTEWNSVDERKRQNEIQQHNKKIKELAKTEYGYEGDDKKIVAKLQLLKTQDGFDLYDGKQLDYNRVISEPSYVEIDHIVPYSISYDDSFNNKVLVKKEHNSAKGNKIPRDYINSSLFFKLENDLWKRLYEDSNSSFKNVKKYEKLTMHDVNRYKAGFIGRNLADTRYASRLVKQAFNSWFDLKLELDNHNLTWNDDDEINVLAVNGKITQTYRFSKYLNIGKKNRDENHHHAIDATICGILGNAKNTLGKLIWINTMRIDDATGEVKFTRKSKYLNGSDTKFPTDEIPWNALGKEVGKIDDIKFSFKVSKKSDNFGFWGDTILSIRDTAEGYKSKKYITPLSYQSYGDAEKAIAALKKEYFKKGRNSYQDPKILEDILKIWDEWSVKCKNDNELKNKNPFIIYMNDVAENNLAKITRPHKPRLYINRNGYEYFVNSLYIYENINSFVPRDKENKKFMEEGKHFGAYTSQEFKEIRIYKLNEDKFRIVSISNDLMKIDDDKKRIVNEKKVNKKLKINVLLPFININKGNCLFEKKSKILYRIVGRKESINVLEIKKLSGKDEKRNLASINTLMKTHSFCHVDVLGNIKKVDF